MIDLHAHTTASDGDLEPDALVAAASAAGVTVLAVTDHDTLGGIETAIASGPRHGVQVIAGIELTTRVPHGSMHLLGYFPTLPAGLGAELHTVSEARERRIRRIVARLEELGVPVTWDSVRGRAAGQLGRPHVADALVEAGYVSSRQDAFDRWLADGKPAHVPSEGFDPVEAVRLVRAFGGAPVMAHPASLGLPTRHLTAFVQRLSAFGLVGIEVHRPEHTPDQRDTFAQIARRMRLVPTGGSDFHRTGSGFGLGDTGTPPLATDTAERLLAAANADGVLPSGA